MAQKIIACILVAMLTLMLLSSVAFGEDFHFRNDISFGDSIDTILEKEGQTFEVYGDKVFSPYMTLSGIPNSTITYFFDNHKLNKIFISYRVRSSKNIDTMMDPYNMIEEGLEQKYGPAITNLNDMIFYRGNLLDPDHNAARTYYAVSQRTLVNDDSIIVIEHALYKNSGNRHSLFYIYLPITDDKDNTVIKDL